MRCGIVALMLALALVSQAGIVWAQGPLPSTPEPDIPRAFIGLVIRDITAEMGKEFGVAPASGVLVMDVGANTPASRAGFERFDILIDVKGNPIRSVADYRAMIFSLDTSTYVDFEILRRSARVHLSVLVAQHPDWRPPTKGPAADPKSQQQQKLSPTVLGMALGSSDQGGVVVRDVQPGSPAAAAGVKSETAILAVSRKPVNRPEDVAWAVDAAKAGASILFLVRIDGTELFIILKKP